MMDHLSLVPYEGGSAGVGAGGGAKYKECLRNHAAAMGGQAFDGCGEYMPASPDSFKCAACGCHRSFHRRAGGGGLGVTAGSPPFFFSPPPPPSHHHQPPHHHPVLQGFVPPLRPPQLALPYHAVPPAAWHHGLLDPAAGRAGSETPPRADDCSPGGCGGSGSFGRKRHRTKFTPEQKVLMRDFAERQGWRINRDDGGALDRFCVEIGVPRNVLKVWMHNHKNQLASPTSVAAAAAAAAGIGVGMNPVHAGMGAGAGAGVGAGTGDGDDDDDTDDDSPPRAAVSSPSPSPISV
jgi:ZF-HD class homeobox domain-containing protein